MGNIYPIRSELLNPRRYADGSIHQLFRILEPVSWQGHFWAVTGYPEARQLLSQPALFSSAYGTGLSSDTPPGLTSLNLSDPPLHTQIRSQVESWLKSLQPAYVLGTNPIRELPRQTLMAILDIDEFQATRLQQLARQVARHQPGANEQLLQALHGTRCPVALEPNDQLYLKRLLTLASLESSSAALAALARTQPQAHLLEEMLRLHPPIQRFGRHVIRDTEWNGQHLKAGQRVIVFFAAANRDPRVFQEPDQWRADRPAHLSFGYGPHHCPGASLARAMLRFLQPQPPEPPQRLYPSNFSLTPED
ncbi:cytochrome P450 [bacterium]|nr:cytochrome P450 [bacterium]